MRLNVGVVFGGKSVEHEVSIITALQMIEQMNQLKYNPITIYLSKENDFYYHENMKDIAFFKDLNQLNMVAKKVIFDKKNNRHQLLSISNKKIKKLFDIDLIFLVVHGSNCEDGTLSAYFEMLDIPYVGSSVLSSAINQNKWKMKELLAYNEIRGVPYYGFYESDFYENEVNIFENCEKIGYPLIVKPASLGSSVGIKKCFNREELHQAILDAVQYDTEVLVEKVIEDLVELNCSVLGECTNLEASVVERVIQQDDILSYQDKYLRGSNKNSKGMESTNRELPANISDALKEEIQKVAIKAVKVIGARGVLRIDFLYDDKNKILFLNEINTIPGSLAFYLWKAKGLKYKELIERLIKLALKTYRIKNSKLISYDTNLLSLPTNLNKGKFMK
ncbi:D-alanine--D-alanine ligase [Mycoplasmatota bacterium]|nr:D-alanine--D-alanine ligase [Mycoplasmatota bacterium]